MNKIDRVKICLVLLIAVIVILPLGIVILNNYQGNFKMRIKNYTFVESDRELKNPKRGFYNLYRFMINDEKVNYWQLVQELYRADGDTKLSLVEINLQNYRDDEISIDGINNIENLFQALSDLDKQLIVRFVYDWEGENEKYEPEDIEIILQHMKQLERILREPEYHIFILQGLFIGNWGEMNGTRYCSDRDLIRLMGRLSAVVDQSIYLAVRTPSQWRKITGLNNISQDSIDSYILAGRISLYNDGMLGNESDYGTYELEETENGLSRSEELAFQEKLCCWVPNGGEVINDNYYNDFVNAVEDMKTMHITYLNAVHDPAVLRKWKETKVDEKGCFAGTDGLTYIERHLGYRLLIKETGIHYNSFKNCIEVNVVMQNVGFAPLYSSTEINLLLYNEKDGECISYEMTGNLRSITGGNDSDKLLTLQSYIPPGELSGMKYEVYFSIKDLSNGDTILLGNEQNPEEYGYCIGNIELY